MKTTPDDWAFAGAYGPGLMKREYFAGLAMQGLLANPKFVPTLDTATAQVFSIAQCALQNADALIAALNSEKSE